MGRGRRQAPVSQAAPSRIAHLPWVPFAILALLWVVVALLVIPTWGWVYWDFGDGNYMYIARRVREGLVLYRDILAPQPPLHTFAGVVAQWLGNAILGDELTGVRLYCLLTRYAASLAVMLLAWRYFECALRGVVAAGIYLFLPIGFWWSLGYQSENLENVFLVAALFLLITWSPRQVAIAGVLGALAAHCNMTGLPYIIVNALFLAFRKPRLFAWYAIPAAVVYFAIALGANVYTEGYFFDNAFLNQTGTFPRTDILSSNPGTPDTFLQYAWGKITSQAWEVVVLEWGFLLAALAGAALRIAAAVPTPATGEPAARDRWLRTEFLAWTLLGMLLSICFTAKGGTVNYIFVLGEPGVALFAAEGFVLLWRRTFPRRADWSGAGLLNTRPILMAMLPIAATLLALWPAIHNIRLSLNQTQVELPEAGALRLRAFIETYAAPGDTILAPPFYAYLTRTIVAGELAENYIWQIKYMNETFDADNYGKPTGEAVAKFDEIAAMLRRQEVKVVLLDLNQTGNVPAIRDAIAEFYQPAEPTPFPTRNTRLGLYIPKGVELHHYPLGASK